MSKKYFKNKYHSLIEISRKYANNEEACVQFFIDCKWTTSSYCEKCGCIHYYSITGRRVIEYIKCKHQQYLFESKEELGIEVSENNITFMTLVHRKD